MANLRLIIVCTVYMATAVFANCCAIGFFVAGSWVPGKGLCKLLSVAYFLHWGVIKRGVTCKRLIKNSSGAARTEL